MRRSKCCFGSKLRELMEFKTRQKTRQLRRAVEPLRQALEFHQRSLEGLESALIEFEDALTEPQQRVERPQQIQQQEAGGSRSALDHGGLPGPRDGQELGLQAYTERGDTLCKARAQHKGQARGPRRVCGEPALQLPVPPGDNCRRSSSIWLASSALSERRGTKKQAVEMERDMLLEE